MHTLQHKHKQVDHANSTDSDSNIENQIPTSEPPTKKLHHSVSKASSSDMSDFKELKELIVTTEKHCQENNKEMVETLKESTWAYERTSKRYLEVLMQLAHN
jgi:cysteinyl-tRNA synthetase